MIFEEKQQKLTKNHENDAIFTQNDDKSKSAKKFSRFAKWQNKNLNVKLRKKTYQLNYSTYFILYLHQFQFTVMGFEKDLITFLKNRWDFCQISSGSIPRCVFWR